MRESKTINRQLRGREKFMFGYRPGKKTMQRVLLQPPCPERSGIFSFDVSAGFVYHLIGFKDLLTVKPYPEQEKFREFLIQLTVVSLCRFIRQRGIFMLKIAIYGKGGIGKSTVTSNLSAAFAMLGKRVIQIGCDPKADSTINLLGGRTLCPVMNFLRENDRNPASLEEISQKGFKDILCIETGGPAPGLGCAGRGIIATFSILEELELFESFKPDVVLYDVLGDVVCGGFAAPIREGYAEHVLIVTSGEKMALYAAKNINAAVENFKDREYASVFGIVLNRRNVENEYERVKAFADKAGLEIVGDIPRSSEITRFEDEGKTAVEGNSGGETAQKFFALAKLLLERA